MRPASLLDRAVPDEEGVANSDGVLLEGLGHRPDIRRPDIVNPILAAFLYGDRSSRTFSKTTS